MIPEGTRTAFGAEGEQLSKRSDAGNSIVQEAFGLVKRSLCGGEEEQLAGGERRQPLFPPQHEEASVGVSATLLQRQSATKTAAGKLPEQMAGDSEADGDGRPWTMPLGTKAASPEAVKPNGSAAAGRSTCPTRVTREERFRSATRNPYGRDAQRGVVAGVGSVAPLILSQSQFLLQFLVVAGHGEGALLAEDALGSGAERLVDPRVLPTAPAAWYHLERWDAARRKPALRQMGVAEIHLGQKQTLPTVVCNLDAGEPLWFGRERKMGMNDKSLPHDHGRALRTSAGGWLMSRVRASRMRARWTSSTII